MENAYTLLRKKGLFHKDTVFFKCDSIGELKAVLSQNGLPLELALNAGKGVSYGSWYCTATPAIPDQVTEYDLGEGTIAFLPSRRLFVLATEGSGINLLPEDIEAGYVDYFNVDIFDESGDEYDGGMYMLKNLYMETYLGNEEKLIADALTLFTGLCGEPFVVLQKERRRF